MKLIAPTGTPHFIADAFAVFKNFNAAHFAHGIERDREVDGFVFAFDAIDYHRADYLAIFHRDGVPRAGEFQGHTGSLLDLGRFGGGEFALLPFKFVGFGETQFLRLHRRKIAHRLRGQGG